MGMVGAAIMTDFLVRGIGPAVGGASVPGSATISSLTPSALICRAISSYYDPIIDRFLAIGKVTVRYRLDSSGQ